MLNAVDARNQYTASGTNDTFAYGFKILANTDIQVFADAVEQTLTTHYTVTGLGVLTGGNIVFVTDPVANTIITIIRKQPLSQLSDYVPNEPFPNERIEKDYDKKVMIDQMLQEQIARALKLPVQSPVTDVDVPALSDAADKFLQVNAGGTGVQWAVAPSSVTEKTLGVVYLSDYASFAAALTSLGSTVATLCIDQAIAVTTDTTSPATLTLWDPGGYTFTVSSGKTLTINGPVIAPIRRTPIFAGAGAVAGLTLCYPGWFGAKGDGGVTNNSTAFTAALAATATRGTIRIPYDGNYYAMTTGVTITKHLAFEADSTAVQFSLAAGIVGFTIGHASDEIIVRFGPLTILSGLTAILFTGANLGKTSCFKGVLCSGQTGKAVDLEAGAGGLIGVRFVDIDIFGNSTATYGLFLEGDFSANTAIFENLHITGTTITAVHVKKTTAGSQSGPEFICPVVEANDGRGFYIYNSEVRLYSPYFEQNGLVTDGKDIELDGDATYQSSVTQIGGTWGASARASSATKVKFLADAMQFNVYGPVTWDATPTIDNNSKISDIGLYGLFAQPTISNATNANIMRYGTRNALYGHGVITGANAHDVVMKNAGAYRFLNAAGTTSANFGVVGDASNHMIHGVPAATNLYGFQFAGTTRLLLQEENSGAGIHLNSESSAAHAAPATGGLVLFLKANGGKTTLYGRFATGAIVPVIVEP